MRTDILEDIKKRLVSEFKFKAKGEWLQQGKCPSCSAKELFTHSETPWVIKCGRLNKCGYERHAKDLYPELFENFNKRYTPTMENPNATADAYMEIARGLNPAKLKGWYRQEKFWHPKGDKGTATVRFDIDREADIYMERLVEPVTIKNEDGSHTLRKMNFRGKHGGLWWQPPGMVFKPNDTVWLVEGCMDAIALNMNGVKAVATLSAGNYPKIKLEEHKDKNITWIFALDNDSIGKRKTKQYVKKTLEAEMKASAAQIPTTKSDAKIDWNDLHIDRKLETENIKDYLYYGDVLIARSAWEKAMLIWGYTNKNSFCMSFNSKLYWFNADIDKLTKAMEEISAAYPDLNEDELREKAIKQAGAIKQICNCYPDFLYYLTHKATNESWYYCRIAFPNGRPSIKTTFTGAQISSSSDFKKRLLSATPGGLYTGGGPQLNWIIENDLNNIKQVDTIDFVGYSKEHGAYIYNDFAVKDGKYIQANSEDYIEIDKLSVKTLSQSFKFEIGKSHQYDANWPELVYKAFDTKGLVALTFWFGSLFAEQIRAAQKSFPFLEIVGEPGSGKTTMIEFLWKTMGLENTEGFDPSKSTFASIRRKFAQVSNMPIVLLEGDREEASKYKKFDFNQLKDSYNGRAFGERGIKNGGNETYAPAFKAAIVIAQNADVQASDAVRERIVHLKFDKSHHSIEGRKASDVLDQIPVEFVSHFLLKAISHEKEVMEHIKKVARRYENDLLSHPKIKNIRIAKNHAQIMAISDCMLKVTGLGDKYTEELHGYIEDLAIERDRAVKADHPLLQEFWDTFEYLDKLGDGNRLNHHRDEGIIAVNLNHFVREAAIEKQQIPALSELKPLLKQTRTHKFIGIKAVNSKINARHNNGPTTVKCWIFKKKDGL